MHLEGGVIPEDYSAYTGKKAALLAGGVILLSAMFVLSIAAGPVHIPVTDVIKTLFLKSDSHRYNIIIFNIRLPQALAAASAGAGLAVSGAAMQSILRNPLGSPFTLGISNAAAFGAAFSVMLTGTGIIYSITNPYFTTASAFLFSMAAAAVILLVSKIRMASPEVMVLTGVTLGSLFTAGTMFLQYFADDVQLAAMVFWTFGDPGRADWREAWVIALVTAAAFIYFFINRWNYNAVLSGDETAKSLGVSVEKVRLFGMAAASLVTAVIISFIGIIGFVGLVCPHVVRRLVGDDHRFLIPGSLLAGGILLLAADIAARTIMSPTVLPVAILTSFLGAPVFMYLLIKGYRR